MKAACILVGLLLCLQEIHGFRPFTRSVRPRVAESTGETLWFTQLVDHFDSSNTDTWQQKYVINATYYNGGDSPIFFFLGGEAALEFFSFQEVQLYNWAQQHGALYIGLEHRYYGKSNPTSDFSTTNMQYLTSQQALADAANFITTIQTSNGYTGKWVVFGCSYSGALSAFFRTKYPDLVVASVAPSGPVQAQLDFTGYYAQFSKSAAPSCVAGAAKATLQVTQLMQTTQGRQTLAQYFNACTSTIEEEDDYFFQYSITGILGGADQMSNPPDWTLNQTCNTLLQSSNYAQNWGQIVIEESGGECTDFSESAFIASMQNVSIEVQDGSRAWTYQTCVEFGYFSTTYNGTSVFFPTLNVERQVEWCAEIFGIAGMTPDVDGTNKYYGGWNLTGTNIMFTNGLLDPWHLLSINEDFSNGAVLSATYEAGHCGSMIAASSVDPPSLTAARERVEQFLDDILQ